MKSNNFNITTKFMRMESEKLSTVIFLLKVHLPNSSSDAQIMLSFAEKKEIFVLSEIAHDWYIASVTIPNGNIRTGFTYYARKNLVKGRNGVVHTECESTQSCLKAGCIGKTHVYAWEFGKEKKDYAIATGSEKLVVNLCTKAPTSGTIVVDHSKEHKDNATKTLELQKGMYLSVMAANELNSEQYLWVNDKTNKSGGRKLKPEYKNRSRTVPAISKRHNIMFREDVWGKGSTSYSCTTHMTFQDDFLKYAYRIQAIYQSSHQMYLAAYDLTRRIIQGRRGIILEQEETEQEEPFSDPMYDIQDEFWDITSIDIEENSKMAKKTSFVKRFIAVTSGPRQAITKLFRSIQRKKVR